MMVVKSNSNYYLVIRQTDLLMTCTSTYTPGIQYLAGGYMSSSTWRVYSAWNLRFKWKLYFTSAKSKIDLADLHIMLKSEISQLRRIFLLNFAWWTLTKIFSRKYEEFKYSSPPPSLLSQQWLSHLLIQLFCMCRSTWHAFCAYPLSFPLIVPSCNWIYILFVILPPICLEFYTAVKFFKYRFDYKLIFLFFRIYSLTWFMHLFHAFCSCLHVFLYFGYMTWLQLVTHGCVIYMISPHFTAFSFKKVARRWLEYNKKVVGRWLSNRVKSPYIFIYTL